MFDHIFWFRFILAAVFYSTAVWAFVYYNRRPDNNFSLLDLVMENGRASKWSVIIMVTFGLSCMIITGWFINGSLLWADFAAFCGIWIAPLIAKMFVPQGNGKEHPPSAPPQKEKHHG